MRKISGINSIGFCMACRLFCMPVLVFFFSVNAFSQTEFRLKYHQERLHEIADFSFLPQGLTPEMLASVPFDDRNANNPVTILPFDGTFYAFRDCFFDVNVWKDSVWVNLYPRKLYGYNCLSRQFIINGRIHSLGRYGFYKMHSELIRWSPRDNRWNIVSVKNFPYDYSTPLMAQMGDSIITIFGHYLRESTGRFEQEKNGYLLDVGNQEWKPLKIKAPNLYRGVVEQSVTIDLDDFMAFKHAKQAVSGYLILDKKSFKLYFWNKPNTYESSPFLFNRGNVMVHQELRTGLIYSDFSQGIDESELVGRIKVAGSSTQVIVLAIVSLVVLVSLLFFITLRKKISRKQFNNQNGLDPDAIDQLITEFSKRSGTTLHVDELDLILEIDHLPNPDYKRVRRSKLVGDINSRFKALHGRELIGRRRNENDKRLMEYPIS